MNESYENGKRTVRQKTLEISALSVAQCEQLAAEMIAGERMLRERAVGDPQRLSRMLGLSERMKGERTAIEPPGIKKPEEVVELKPKLKRRVGQRKPKRDDVP